MSVVREAGQLGVTRILTRREILHRAIGVIGTVLIAAAALWAGLRVAAWVTGSEPARITTRPLLDGPEGGSLITGTKQFQFPLKLTLGEPVWWIVVPIALVLFVVGFRYLIAPVFRRLDHEPRHQALATAKRVRQVFGPAAIRRAGKFTLPDHTRAERRRLPLPAFGIHLGKSVTPAKGGDLWVSGDDRVRLVARPGWGKTFRFLVPIVRQLTGPALVSSVEPGIFLATVKARETRWPDGRRRHLPVRVPANPFDPSSKAGWERPAPQEYPVYVVEIGPQENRVADAYPSLKWNPIPGCEIYTTALRRAEALIKGVDEGKDSQGETSRWFDAVGSQVIAAWLHAAAFDPAVEVPTIAEWLRHKDIETPRRILAAQAAADPVAASHLVKHLAAEGGRTTANLETVLARALGALVSTEGTRVMGSRHDVDQFDMRGFIEDDATLYLLAEEAPMKVCRPLLCLIASEVALAGEQVARSRPGNIKRLTRPLWLVLDEFRRGVRLPDLPDIAQTKRKFGIMFAYVCTSGRDEEAMYGPDDAAVLQGACVSIYGGYDKHSHQEITEVAGKAPVVAASKGKDHRSESEDYRDALTAADLQRMTAGQCVIVGHGVAPFIAHAPSVYDQRRLSRQVAREAREVAAA